MLSGEAAGEQVVEQGVAQAVGGGDDRLGALYGVVDAVQHGGDGPLLRKGREQDGETVYVFPRYSLDCCSPRQSLYFVSSTIQYPVKEATVGCAFGFNERNVLACSQHLAGNPDQPNPRSGGKEQVASFADNGIT